MTDYKEKYLKYKIKYCKLKNSLMDQIGGMNDDLQSDPQYPPLPPTVVPLPPAIRYPPLPSLSPTPPPTPPEPPPEPPSQMVASVDSIQLVNHSNIFKILLYCHGESESYQPSVNSLNLLDEIKRSFVPEIIRTIKEYWDIDIEWPESTTLAEYKDQLLDNNLQIDSINIDPSATPTILLSNRLEIIEADSQYYQQYDMVVNVNCDYPGFWCFKPQQKKGDPTMIDMPRLKDETDHAFYSRRNTRLGNDNDVTIILQNMVNLLKNDNSVLLLKFTEEEMTCWKHIITTQLTQTKPNWTHVYSEEYCKFIVN